MTDEQLIRALADVSFGDILEELGAISTHLREAVGSISTGNRAGAAMDIEDAHESAEQLTNAAKRMQEIIGRLVFMEGGEV